MWGKEGRVKGGGNGGVKGGEKWVGLRVGENRGDLGWEKGGDSSVGKRG